MGVNEVIANAGVATDRSGAVGRASVQHLQKIRAIVRQSAEGAGLSDPETFAHSWHILMKASIVAAAEGDRQAARRAKAMGRTLIEQYRDQPAAQ